MRTGKYIEKWKNKGVSEFIMEMCANQIVRNTINGNPTQSLKIPMEALPFILGYTLNVGDVSQSTFMGVKIEVF